jgi:hypothetical protein
MYLSWSAAARSFTPMATPRIAFADLPRGLRKQLRPRVDRLGYLGEFFQVAAHQPEALGHFIGFTETLKLSLPLRLVEVIALTVAAETGNDYERVQHERLALSIGLEEHEVRALVDGSIDGATTFDETEIAAAELARAVTRARGRSCREPYERLEALAPPEVAVACLMVATRYLAHATMANTWGLKPPVESPLAAEAARA